MKKLSSGMKTWLKRNGFVGEGKPPTPMRASNGYVDRNMRKFRIRESTNEVDIGELKETFDRWANSRERTISIEEFKLEFSK
jgi:hypothetical protein